MCAEECRSEAVKELVKAASTTRVACGHLSLQSIGSARLNQISSGTCLTQVKPMVIDSFNGYHDIPLPEVPGNGIVAGYLVQCAAHANEEYMVCDSLYLLLHAGGSTSHFHKPA